MTWIHVLRQDVAPVLGAYVVFLAFLVAYRRSPRPGQDQGRAAATWREAIGYLASTVAGGYAVFLVIVVLFYFVLGNEEGSLITQAVREGSVLVLVIVVPAFALLSWIDGRRRGERPGRSSGRGRP